MSHLIASSSLSSNYLTEEEEDEGNDKEENTSSKPLENGDASGAQVRMSYFCPPTDGLSPKKSSGGSIAAWMGRGKG